MPLKDPEKRREYHAKYYRERLAADPAFKAKHYQHKSRVKAEYRKRAAKIIAEFRINGCRVCGELESCCLSAHHVDPSEKDFDIANIIRCQRKLEHLVSELRKCVCLCENCHRKLHAGVINLPD